MTTADPCPASRTVASPWPMSQATITQPDGGQPVSGGRQMAISRPSERPANSTGRDETWKTAQVASGTITINNCHGPCQVRDAASREADRCATSRIQLAQTPANQPTG